MPESLLKACKSYVKYSARPDLLLENIQPEYHHQITECYCGSPDEAIYNPSTNEYRCFKHYEYEDTD